jgi:flagellar basal body-associated protein FliL
MKKLVLMLAVVFSASLFSCVNSDKKAEATDSAAVDTAIVVEETVAVDTNAAGQADTTVTVDAAVVADSAAAK